MEFHPLPELGLLPMQGNQSRRGQRPGQTLTLEDTQDSQAVAAPEHQWKAEPKADVVPVAEKTSISLVLHIPRARWIGGDNIDN